MRLAVFLVPSLMLAAHFVLRTTREAPTAASTSAPPTAPSSSSGTSGQTGTDDPGHAASSATATGSAAASAPPGAAGARCPPGQVCVSKFPFHHASDTSTGGSKKLDAYSCNPASKQGGRERIYRVTVAEPGFLSAAVYDDDGVDVDVHILRNLDPAACLARGDRHASADVLPGTYHVVVDSHVAGGEAQEGPYQLDIGLLVPSVGPCDMRDGAMPRVGDAGRHLAMPATGPVAREAHLVTRQDPAPYPTSPTDRLDEHYRRSQQATGLVMHRGRTWAPKEGGGAFHGAGIGAPEDLPAQHEGWYVTMRWTASARPARGTPMILRRPGTTRAVVAAAGYETGPSDLAHVGGTTEEAHFYLGTGHLAELQLGLASDPRLPLGPRVCTD